MAEDLEAGRLADRNLDLAKQFMDEEYRRAWAEDYLDTGLALQIAALRNQRGWNQVELAKRAGTAQSAVSRMEDVGYGAHSIRVLKQLAAAFGLRLKVSFEEFGTLLQESGEFSESRLGRHCFEQDPKIAMLLSAQGFALQTEQPPGLSGSTDEPPFDPTAEIALSRLTFDEQVETVLGLSLTDRVQHLKSWLIGNGLPSPEEPVYKQLYFAIPSDHRHAPLAISMAEACAELLLPEAFAEFLSDPDDGEEALDNLLSLSVVLRAGTAATVAASCSLLKWLSGEWQILSGNLKGAVIDLVVGLGHVELAEIVLGWPSEAGLDERHRLILSCHSLVSQPIQSLTRSRLALCFEPMLIRDALDPLVQQVSEQVIRALAPVHDVDRELRQAPREKGGIAATHLNIIVRVEPDLVPVAA